MSLLQENAPASEKTRKAARRGAEAKRAAREILLVAVLFFAYKLGRLAANGHVGEALGNAQHVWHLERLLYLPSEFSLQQLFLGQEWLIKVANCYYAYVHFPATAACLIFLYIWRRDRYVSTRRLLAWLTAAALVVHLLMPLAPPRMLTAIGMVDTGRVFGPAVYGSPSTDTLTNQYAAMPSLHVAWALAIAIALMGITRSKWRWLWLAHPAITLFVVVVTGNHYWLDAIVATVLLGLVAAALNGRANAAVPAVIPKPRTGEI
ncbi:membrane-associated phospholipid phosphatase [Actinoplanes tereljensis]|uniref:Inositol phosphorylceramide synthase n=1 Tax=Paractinoplanes tereljensis TaxID=571912 RepID=A0A919NQ02_9ACTN|nr:phosphatase PAP2 family protein [Actinoplanes tereljensis]GIF21929.1 inositol phosphorylceramide synthase [Actinoplanes tereljensis]